MQNGKYAAQEERALLNAERYMAEALREAGQATDEVPVGAVIVRDGKIIARAHNERESGAPFAHAEMLAMERACQALHTRRLHGCTMYVTLEPCPMCAGGMMMAELEACVFGAYDARQGCCGSVYCLPEDPCFYHRTRIMGGVMEEDCAALLQAFFRRKRTATPEEPDTNCP